MIKLYLRGENKSKLNNLFKRAESLKKFRIDFSPKAISNCPVRRYFESNLALNLLQSLSSHPVISIVEEFTACIKSGIAYYARVVDKELADKFAERDNLPFLKSSSAIEKDINDGYECGWDGMRDKTTIAIKLISVSDEMAEYFNERQHESLMKFNKYVFFEAL